MGTVNQILRSKGSKVFSIAPTDTVYHALEIMMEKNLGAVVVMESENLVGIFTERDYARKVIIKGKRSMNTLVSEVMSKNVVTINPQDSIENCMRLMSDKFIRHLPVIENDLLVGIISIGDVVKNIMEDQQFIIDNLEHYIGGRHQ